MKDWRLYSAEELDGQYRGIVPADFEARVIPDWQRRSAEFRERAAGRLDLPYGEGPRERLDLFVGRPEGRGPLVVFFHGGYWQRFDKSVFSFVAEGLVANGVSVALPSYDLCPSVRLGRITEQARRAVAWLWRSADALGFSRDRIHLAGHSAGGHLVGMALATEWARLAPDLPDDLAKSGTPISGLFELEPLRRSYLNVRLRMDEAEAAAESPINNPPRAGAPQLVVCGELEPDEFHRQSDAYVAAFAHRGRCMERYTAPGRGHMNVLDDLAGDGGVLLEKVLQLVLP